MPNMKTPLFAFLCIIYSHTYTGKALAQDNLYNAAYNDCYSGRSVEFCHCIADQQIYRAADGLGSLQYCLEKINGIQQDREAILRKLEEIEWFAKRTQKCVAEAIRYHPITTSNAEIFCNCGTTKHFYEGLSLMETQRICEKMLE